MPDRIPETQEVAIVLLGDFNPKIFQPAWFASHGLMRDKEAESADIKVIHPEIAQFSLDWLTLTVTRGQFVAASSADSPFELLRDLVTGCFELLVHTPVQFMGINRNMDYLLASEDELHALGFHLVPQASWSKLFSDPRMASVVVQDIRKEPPGFAQVQLSPSRKVFPGVFVAANNHYETLGAEDAVKILRASWQAAIQWPLEVLDTLMEGIA